MPKKPTFEEAIARLEDIAKTLERGDASIEQSLALFDEGTKLLKFCNTTLSEAEQKVSILVGKTPDGEPVVEDFDAE